MYKVMLLSCQLNMDIRVIRLYNDFQKLLKHQSLGGGRLLLLHTLLQILYNPTARISVIHDSHGLKGC